MAEESTPTYSRLERVLAYASSSVIVLAVVAFIATLVAGLIVGEDRTVLERGFWPVVVWIAYAGLPLGFVLLMVLLGINFSRRGSGKRSSK